MNKLEVGMYVRYKNGIGKIVAKYVKGILLDKGKGGYFRTECVDILKASHNIIDLIEVGDYVNGFPVVEIPYMDNGKIVYKLHCGNNLLICNENHNIKSIVTKEQFEAIKYEVN